MNVREQYNKNKLLFIAIALIAGTFVITGSILLIKWYKKRQAGHMKANGIQPSTEDLLTEFEGRSNVVYLDETGKPTVGIGHLVLPNDMLSVGQKITDAEVDDYFRRDTNDAQNEVDRGITASLNQNQNDALVSLIFNEGVGAIDGSTVRKMINSGASEDKIRAAWMMWDKETKNGVLVESDNLKSRRQKEVDLYFS